MNLSELQQAVIDCLRKQTKRLPAGQVRDLIGVATCSGVVHILDGLAAVGIADRVVGAGWALTEKYRRDTEGTWVVYTGTTTSTSVWASFDTEDSAIQFATEQVGKYKGEYFIAKLVARVKPVTQPKFEIERV